MYKISFKAKKIDVSKNIEDQYYMIAIADNDKEYDNYVIFQKTFDPDELEEDSELSNTYIECNGEACYNCCENITLDKSLILKFVVKGTDFNIDLNDIKIPDSFYEYMHEIFEDSFRKN